MFGTFDSVFVGEIEAPRADHNIVECTFGSKDHLLQVQTPSDSDVSDPFGKLIEIGESV